MIYDHPRFYRILGVSLLRDHLDPLQYYYLPMAPRLAEFIDQTTGKTIPMFQLIKYRGEAGNGGFLNFDVNLRVDEEKLEEIRDELRRAEDLPDRPRLAPVPVIDGTVKLMLLGKQSGDIITPDATLPTFVLKINHHAKPALYGDNNASFSLELDAAGVTVLEQALQGEMIPIGVVYSFDFHVLRPAYSVRLNVNWDLVQKHLDEHYGVDALFFSTDIDKIVDELTEQRVIVIEADTFVPEGEDNEGIISRRDQAENQVREMVTETFFEPTLNPMTTQEEADGWDKAAEFAERMSQLHVSGGLSSFGGVSYRKLDKTRVERKSLVVNINERTTVKRSIYPQGHLRNVLGTTGPGGRDLSGYVISVDLDDPWFQRRRVAVISRGNFEADSISSLNVRLNYGGHPQNVLLETSTARDSVEWASIVQDGAMQREVLASYQVSFKDVDSAERPITLFSPERVVDIENLEVDPRELYAIVPVPIVALNFPWGRYPHVEVQVRYSDVANGVRLDEVFLLDSTNQEQIWKIFVRDPQQTQFEYKLIYRAFDHQDVEMPWVETVEERLTIRDPYPQKRKIAVVPNFDWTFVERAFVDLSYEDPDNDIFEEESFEFSASKADSQTFEVDLANPDQRLMAYEATILFKNHDRADIPRSYTLERRIILREDMRGHKIIRLRPEQVNFAMRHIRELYVETRYEDQEAGLSYADRFTFKTPGDVAHFEFDYVDSQRDRYEYRLTALFDNGLSLTKDWIQTDREELTVPVG